MGILVLTISVPDSRNEVRVIEEAPVIPDLPVLCLKLDGLYELLVCFVLFVFLGEEQGYLGKCKLYEIFLKNTIVEVEFCSGF